MQLPHVRSQPPAQDVGAAWRQDVRSVANETYNNAHFSVTACLVNNQRALGIRKYYS